MPDDSTSKPSLDLSDLRLMPQWVADFSKAAPSKYSDMPEESDRDRRGPRDGGQGRRGGAGGGGGGFRGERRDGGGGPRTGGGGGGGFRGERRGGPPTGERKPFERRDGGGPRRDDRGGPPRGDRRGGGDRRGFGNRDDRPHYEAPPTIAGLTTFIEPEKKSTEALATTIRTAGKAFSVFDAARLVLQSGDRFHVKFTVPADSPVKLCTIPADGSVWLGREEAVSHFLNSEGIKEFYRVEDIELEEPKGVFTSIAVCGMTGEILGPASHHSYQTALHRIHRERFSDMRFEDYKRRVRTENTPEIIEKWKESQKRGQEWVYLTPALEDGAEPLKLKSRAEMESHFRKTHAETLVHETNEAWVAGNIPKRNLSPALFHALRRGVEEARKHLLPVAQLLCSGFEGQGLKLFKRRGGKLWVSRTRPKALDTSTVLSTRIAKLLEIIKAKPGIAVKDLIELVAPSEEAPKAESVGPQTAPVAEAAAPDTTENITAEATAEPVAEAEVPAPAAAETAPAPVAAPAQPQANAEQLHALQDLHWLNSEGYIIEYSDGIVFIGVTEPPPPKPKAAKVPAAAPATAEVKPESGEAPAETAADEAADAGVVEDGIAAAAESADESAVVSAEADAVQDAPEASHENEDEPAAAPFSFLDEAPASDSKDQANPGQ